MFGYPIKNMIDECSLNNNNANLVPVESNNNSQTGGDNHPSNEDDVMGILTNPPVYENVESNMDNENENNNSNDYLNEDVLDFDINSNSNSINMENTVNSINSINGNTDMSNSAIVENSIANENSDDVITTPDNPNNVTTGEYIDSEGNTRVYEINSVPNEEMDSTKINENVIVEPTENGANLIVNGNVVSELENEDEINNVNSDGEVTETFIIGGNKLIENDLFQSVRQIIMDITGLDETISNFIVMLLIGLGIYLILKKFNVV